MTLYQNIAATLTDHIEQGAYRPGQRLPGVRALSQQFGVSVSTVVQAQRALENAGVLEARPRSGYYVRPQVWQRPELPAPSRTLQRPMPVTGQELSLHLANAVNQPGMIRLGAAVPHNDFLPVRSVQRSLTKVARNQSAQATHYAFPPGLPQLQQHIAGRMALAGSRVNADDIIITNGGHEALTLALRAVAQPGDVIALESPTFYGLLQVIESMGLKALEIPTDPQTGISLPALEMALEQWPIKACVLIPNFHNPLGFMMNDAHKRRLAALASQHQLILIEDDIYGDLGHNGERPCCLHGLNPGQVIHCSSFSKTVSPGLRLGWMLVPERLRQQVEYHKYVTNLATNTVSQLAMIDYLEHGHHDRYLRQIRDRYALQVSLFARAISKYFPEGTRVSQPQGGFVLWVELAPDLDGLALTHRLLEHKISIAPGRLFSANQKYHNCIRLNCAQPWSAEMDKALMTIGRLCGEAG
ncbi:MAG: PLP-dependent aminotransferase family protein [Marinobacter sp.]|nr:PLP-dependent aminotransferase family protein [Marinobacter sp.]